MLDIEFELILKDLKEIKKTLIELYNENYPEHLNQIKKNLCEIEKKIDRLQSSLDTKQTADIKNNVNSKAEKTELITELKEPIEINHDKMNSVDVTNIKQNRTMLKCNVCGHVWKSFKLIPKRCVSRACRSMRWNKSLI